MESKSGENSESLLGYGDFLFGWLVGTFRLYSTQFLYYYCNFCRRETLYLCSFFHFWELAKGLKLIILYLLIYQIDEQQTHDF